MLLRRAASRFLPQAYDLRCQSPFAQARRERLKAATVLPPPALRQPCAACRRHARPDIIFLRRFHRDAAHVTPSHVPPVAARYIRR